MPLTTENTPEIAQAGDEGFEWGAGYRLDGGGLKFTKTLDGLIVAIGYAYYAGPFVPNSVICSLPAGWRDYQGAEALCTGSGDPANTVNVYAGSTALHAGNAESLPADGYISVQAIWTAV